MNRKLSFAFGAFLFTSSILVSAQEELPGKKYDSISAAEAASKPDDLICKYESVTGSHLKKRVCATKAQRAAATKSAQEDIQFRAKSAPLMPKN